MTWHNKQTNKESPNKILLISLNDRAEKIFMSNEGFANLLALIWKIKDLKSSFALLIKLILIFENVSWNSAWN